MGIMKDEYIKLQNEQNPHNPIVYTTAFTKNRQDMRELVRKLLENNMVLVNTTLQMKARYDTGPRMYAYQIGNKNHPIYYSVKEDKWVVFYRMRFDTEYHR